jgi:hypothetical protein
VPGEEKKIGNPQCHGKMRGDLECQKRYSDSVEKDSVEDTAAVVFAVIEWFMEIEGLQLPRRCAGKYTVYVFGSVIGVMLPIVSVNTPIAAFGDSEPQGWVSEICHNYPSFGKLAKR